MTPTPGSGILPLRGGQAFMKALKITDAVVPPMGIGGSTIHIPVKVNNSRPIARPIMIKVTDTHSDGTVTPAGVLNASANPGDNEYSVQITLPKKIGVDNIKIELFCMMFRFIPRLHDCKEFKMEKTTFIQSSSG